jgi:hypothetical protein
MNCPKCHSQAAYSLIEKERKKEIHLTIGRLLLVNTPAALPVSECRDQPPPLFTILRKKYQNYIFFSRRIVTFC